MLKKILTKLQSSELKIKHYLFIVLIVAFIISSFFYLSYQNKNKAYLASNVMGQDAAGSDDYLASYKDNAPPNNQGFSGPSMTLIDEINHHLFVSDYVNNRVLIFNLTESNELEDSTADYVLGQSDFTSNESATTQSGMKYPIGMAINTASNTLYVAELSNNRVLVFDLSDGITNGENAINVLGQSNFTSGGSATTQGGMKTPWDIYYNNVSSSLYVADFNNSRVLVFDLSDGISNGEDAVYVLGQSNFTSGGSATTQGGMYRPSGLEYDYVNNRLFVGEYTNNRVLVFDLSDGISNGEDAVYVLGQSNFTSGGTATTQGGLKYPSGLCFNPSQNYLYVPDYSNNRIMVFNLADGIVNGEDAINVLGQSNFTSATSSVSASNLSAPKGCSISTSTNKLFVSDYSNNRVAVYNIASLSNGEDAVDILGQLNGSDEAVFTTNFTNNTSPSTSGLNQPHELFLDTTNHRLFVADTINNRVLVFNLDTDNNLIDETADYVLGQSDFDSTAEDTTQNNFNGPHGMDYDYENDLLFVADRGNGRVLVFDLSDGITNGEDAVNVLGQGDFISADLVTTQAGMYDSTDVVFDSVSSTLYVTDCNNGRVTTYDLSDGISNGESAVNVLGQPNFTSSSWIPGQALLACPHDLEYDRTNGRLIVADEYNHRIIFYNLADGVANGEDATYVIGQSDFDTATTGSTQSKLNQPYDLTYNSNSERLYVSDTANDRIMIFNLADGIVNGENAESVMGQDDFTSKTGETTQEKIDYPRAMQFDLDNNRLWLADTYNNRILAFNFVQPSGASSYETAYYGQGYSSDIASATNYQGTIGYSVASGTLPTGLSINSSTGVISGAPSVTGTYSFAISATDTLAVASFTGNSSDYSITSEYPPLGFSAETGSALESAGSSNITVSLLATSTYNVSAVYTLTDGTAVSSTDYTFATGTITIASGTLSNTFSVNFSDDSDVESDETFTITLSSPTNAVIGSTSTLTFTITNDDEAPSTGGGSAYISHPAPTPPPETGFAVEINSGADNTAKSAVNITFTSGNDTEKYALSNTEDFLNASILDLDTDIVGWDLCGNKTNCASGIYTVYAKLYSEWNIASEIISDTIYYNAPGVKADIEIIEVLTEEQNQEQEQENEKAESQSDEEKKIIIIKNTTETKQTTPKIITPVEISKQEILSNIKIDLDKILNSLPKQKDSFEMKGNEETLAQIQNLAKALLEINIIKGEEISNILNTEIKNVKQEKNFILQLKAIVEANEKILSGEYLGPFFIPYYTFGSVVLNAFVTNPANISSTINIKLKMPIGTVPTDVKNMNGFAFIFDENTKNWVAFKSIELGPNESKIESLLMENKWELTEDKIKELKKQAIIVTHTEEDDAFDKMFGVGRTIINKKFDKIWDKQINSYLSPEEQMDTFAENKAEINSLLKTMRTMGEVQAWKNNSKTQALNVLQSKIFWPVLILVSFLLSIITLVVKKLHKQKKLTKKHIFGCKVMDVLIKNKCSVKKKNKKQA